MDRFARKEIHMPKSFITLLIILVSSLIAMSAGAEILAVCGPYAGKSYFVEDGVIIQEKDAGWTDDKTSIGSTILTKNDDQFDILFRDATGKTMSAIAEGGTVFTTYRDADKILVVVLYPSTIENYGFFFKQWKTINVNGPNERWYDQQRCSLSGRMFTVPINMSQQRQYCIWKL